MTLMFDISGALSPEEPSYNKVENVDEVFDLKTHRDEACDAA